MSAPKWGWRGAHPGAGVTTLAEHLGGADLGVGLPAPRHPLATLPTLVVCRSSFDGLVAAQQLAATELSRPDRWSCVGLVVVADSSVPQVGAELELVALVAGGYPAHWTIPWMEVWHESDHDRGASPSTRLLARLLPSRAHQVSPRTTRPTKEQP